VLLLRYRGGEGMLAWAFHRISGVGIWAFVVLHVIDIYLAGSNPQMYDELLAFYASPVGRVLEVVLGAALLYHALNGLRIIIMDFWPPLTRFHRQMWYASWVVFVLVGVPVAWVILKPIWGM
jgi:succinate dehydrogenase / fumarate reductase cytochrome b subunit